MRVADADRFLTRHKTGRAEGIDTNITQRTATCFRLVADVVGVLRIVKAEHGIHEHQIPDHTAGEQFFGASELRVMDDHIGFGSQKTRRITSSDDRVKIRLFHRHRLFTENVFPSSQRFERPFDMEVVRQRNIDGFNLWISEKRIVAVVDNEVRVESLKISGFLGAGCGERVELRPLSSMDRPRHMFTRKLCGPQNTPLYRFHRCSPCSR